MKIIKLTLWTDEPENRYSYNISVPENQFSKSKKIIDKVNNPHVMPDIRVIQDDYQMSDELDFVMEALQSAGIKPLLPVTPNFQWDIYEGISSKEEYDKYIKSIKSKESAERVNKLTKPVLIQLNLETDEYDNNYTWTIAVEEKDLDKAKRLIQDLTDKNHMPEIRVIQDELMMSDELDVVEDFLNRSGIKTMPLHIDEEISIGEGVAEKEQSDAFLKSLKPKSKSKGAKN